MTFELRRPTPDATAAAGSDGTPIRVTIGATVLTARLRDNPTARDLLTQLPLTLTFRDRGGVEKIARLPRALTMEGVPAGADPEIRDIGYYAPSNDLVLYYGEVGYWAGIVPHRPLRRRHRVGPGSRRRSHGHDRASQLTEERTPSRPLTTVVQDFTAIAEHR